ncbi:bacitracin ABC transporter ATP-binding protein [Bacillus cereus]|uniref:bacitracin ABC transporter ATP-binding protein n=1 Tax=Bacillus cereus TaxID=1396 RepID=UPI003D346DF5
MEGEEKPPLIKVSIYQYRLGGIDLSKEKKPLLSDAFLDKITIEINKLYGNTTEEQNSSQENKRNK